MPRNLKLYITGLVAASAFALLAASLVFPGVSGWAFGIRPSIGPGLVADPGLDALFGVAFWTLLTLLASALPVQIPRGSVVSVSIATIVATMALGGPVAAGWVALIGTTELRELRGARKDARLRAGRRRRQGGGRWKIRQRPAIAQRVPPRRQRLRMAIERVARAARFLGKAEEWLYGARFAAEPEVAFVSPRSTEFWGAGPGLGVTAFENAKWVYLALNHAHIPVDILSEQQLAEGKLDRFKAIYIPGTNLRRDAAAAVKEWVRAGGALWTDASGLARDEANQPATPLAEVLGLPGDSSEKDVAKAMASATPDQLLALKQADQDFAVRMRELDIDLEKIAAGDRDSARRREAQVRDWMPRVLAFVVVAGFMATVFLVLLGLVDGMKDPLMATTVGTLIGFVSAKAEQVIAYYFGSSSSSQQKTQLLAGSQK